MRPAARLSLPPVLALMVLAILSPPAASDGEPCSACHTGQNPSGGYLIKMPTLTADHPSIVPPETTFNYTLKVVHSGKFKMRGATVTVKVDGLAASEPGRELSWRPPNLEEAGGTRTKGWSFTTANATGRLLVNATLRFDARWRHSTGGDNDENPYILRSYSAVQVRSVALYKTATDISLPAEPGRGTTFDLVAYTELRNLTLSASGNLAGSVALAPGSIGGLAPGQRHTVQLYVRGSPAPVDNGRIDLVWEDAEGGRHSDFVMVELAGSPAPSSVGPVRLTARVTGMLSLGLLAASVVFGLVRKGGRRRVRVHCAVSWFILGLGIYHGLMLVIWPYNRVWLSGPVVLAYLSAVMMGVSSVNGLVQRWMVRKLGRRAWLWTHRLTLVAAIVLVVVHALLIGTDFRFLHPEAGPGK